MTGRRKHLAGVDQACLRLLAIYVIQEKWDCAPEEDDENVLSSQCPCLAEKEHNALPVLQNDLLGTTRTILY